MRYLYLDTSSNFLYTAIVEDNKLVIEEKKEYGKNLSTECLKDIEEMFKKVQLTPTDINKIILVNGPGSFTGCRIGITIAKTMAWGLNLDITTISSLEAMSLIDDEYEFHIPLIDARRDYVFAGIYDAQNNQVLRNQYIKREVLEIAASKLEDNFIYVTNDNLDLNGPIVNYNPNILKIVEKYKDKANINPHIIDADYLKLTEAEEKLNA